jgi:hypothetical protein
MLSCILALRYSRRHTDSSESNTHAHSATELDSG